MMISWSVVPRSPAVSMSAAGERADEENQISGTPLRRNDEHQPRGS